MEGLEDGAIDVAPSLEQLLDMPGTAASGAAAASGSGRSSSSDSDDMTRIIESMQREKDKEKKP